MNASFFELEEYHAELAAIFAEHQEAIVDRRFADAISLLRRFRSAFECHVTEEEEHLLPMFKSYAGNVAGGSDAAFRAEHRKLEAMLDDVEHEVRDAAEEGTAAARIRVVEVESHFKGLLEHHMAREHNVLFPTLDRILGATERRRLIDACSCHVPATGESLEIPEHGDSLTRT